MLGTLKLFPAYNFLEWYKLNYIVIGVGQNVELYSI